jgi:hypothetical protein
MSLILGIKVHKAGNMIITDGNNENVFQNDEVLLNAVLRIFLFRNKLKNG